MMEFNPHLQGARSELLDAVEAMGGKRLLTAIDNLVRDNEEYTVDWFDARWDDLTAEELAGWSITKLAKTGPTIAHAALEVRLCTYPVDENDDDAVPGAETGVPAFIRVILSPQIQADRYELNFQHLGEWILHDAIRFTD